MISCTPLRPPLDAEADQLCGAGRYERSEARQDTRAGSYERTLQTSAGDVNIKIPKLRRQTFETAIIERYLSMPRRAGKPPTGRRAPSSTTYEPPG
jgi:transposase-like protein